jgi:hypothetical protein
MADIITAQVGAAFYLPGDGEDLNWPAKWFDFARKDNTQR